MRKTFLLLLLLVAVMPTEIPELVHLGDNVSNDFVQISLGCQSTPVMDVGDAGVAISIEAIVPAVLLPVSKSFDVPVVERPFQGAGQALRCMCSILRT